MSAPLSRLSIYLKLPLGVAGLLLAVVALFASLACRQVSGAANGGRIQVQSQLGKGSVFPVQLCRTLSLGGVADQGSPHPGEGEVGGTILPVEDYSELRSVAGRELSRAGCRVIPAETGEDALRLVEAGLRPDLLVSDIGLPGINRVRMEEIVRQAHPAIKVLLVSGSKDYGHLLKSIDNQSFLAKPYRVEELVQRVRAIFRKPVAKASEV